MAVRKKASPYTREQILEAAARAFARAGLQSATMRDIAREAGCAAPSIYNYFSSKDEIIDRLVLLINDDFQRIFQEPVASGLSLRQSVELLLKHQLGKAEQRREIFAVVAALRPGVVFSALDSGTGKNQKKRPTTLIEVQVQRLAVWFQENASRADLDDLAYEDVARFFVGLSHAFFIKWASLGLPTGWLVERSGLLLRLFMNGVSPAGAPGRKQPRSRSREE
jgi:AcrR family transcriptional regulator